jgi:hypothetical protein
MQRKMSTYSSQRTARTCIRSARSGLAWVRLTSCYIAKLLYTTPMLQHKRQHAATFRYAQESARRIQVSWNSESNQ